MEKIKIIKPIQIEGHFLGIGDFLHKDKKKEGKYKVVKEEGPNDKTIFVTLSDEQIESSINRQIMNEVKDTKEEPFKRRGSNRDTSNED